MLESSKTDMKKKKMTSKDISLPIQISREDSGLKKIADSTQSLDFIKNDGDCLGGGNINLCAMLGIDVEQMALDIVNQDLD